MAETISHASRDLEVRGLTEFPAEGVERVVEETHGEHVVQGWPALVDAGESVDLRVRVTHAEQVVAMRTGVRRLMRLRTPVPVRYVVGVLSMKEKIALGHTPHGSVPALLDDALGACLDAGVARAAAGAPAGFADGLPWTRPAYDAALAAAQDRLGDEVLRVVKQAALVLELSTEVRTRLPGVTAPSFAGLRRDVEAQVDALLPDGFITLAGVDRMPDLVRYLRAVVRRLDTAPEDTGRDALRQSQIEAITDEWRDVVAALHPAERESAAAQDVRWMIEELRVNLFAQNLGTKHPVSDKRIQKALDALLA